MRQFHESDVNRSSDGKFAHKTFSADEISLSPDVVTQKGYVLSEAQAARYEVLLPQCSYGPNYDRNASYGLVQAMRSEDSFGVEFALASAEGATYAEASASGTTAQSDGFADVRTVSCPRRMLPGWAGDHGEIAAVTRERFGPKDCDEAIATARHKQAVVPVGPPTGTISRTDDGTVHRHVFATPSPYAPLLIHERHFKAVKDPGNPTMAQIRETEFWHRASTLEHNADKDVLWRHSALVPELWNRDSDDIAWTILEEAADRSAGGPPPQVTTNLLSKRPRDSEQGLSVS